MYSSGSTMEQRDCAQGTVLQITQLLTSMVISCTVHMESFLCLLLYRSHQLYLGSVTDQHICSNC